MSEPRVLRIAMNGITGRMGYRQHLLRSILPIRDQGGMTLADGSRVQVEPILVGRNEAKLEELAAAARRRALDAPTSTRVINDPTVDVFFDASMTSLRAADPARRPCAPASTSSPRSPTAETLDEAVELARSPRTRHHRRRRPRQALPARAGQAAPPGGRGLLRPDPLAARRVRLLGLRGRRTSPPSAPPGTTAREDGGGITTDMFCHWNYVLEGIVGPVTDRHRAQPPRTSRSAGTSRASAYAATADDAAYGIFELETPAGDPVVGQINSSWAVRVYRDELVEFQVDGTHGSAVAGLNNCVAQQRAHTPEAGLEPGPARHRVLPRPVAGGAGQRRAGQRLQGAVGGVPAPTSPPAATHRFGLLSAARGVQLAELGLRSSAERRTLDIPEIAL